ncbi:MAG: universal stress protein [Bacteroidales bacterium]|nr:universal stress protein [Bacteroidales bacterium]
MKRILVPVDFSPHTETVCRYALEIAKLNGAEIRLFHAYFDFIIATASTFPYSVETNELFNQEMMVKIKEDARKDMDKLHHEMMDEIAHEGIKNVRVVFTLTGGMPEEEILNISETYNPDLIVMGTRGKGEKDLLTGKVSSKVVQSATCRILTVPRDAKYHGFKNVVYATDLKGDDFEYLSTLIDLVSNYKPVIHCIHVDLDYEPEAGKNKMNALMQHFRSETEIGSIVFKVIGDDDFLSCIDDYIQKQQIDMVAVVHHRKSFLKRLFTIDHTRQLLFHSGLPLYIFTGEA